MPPERAGAVAGVILAAGMSQRMGSNKLLLEIDGVSMIRHVVSRAACADLDPVLVVLGFDAERLVPELKGLRCSVVVNSEYERGMNSSFRLGMSLAREHADAAVVMLGDMPFVTAAKIGELVTRYRASDAPLVVSQYGHVTAPPTLFDRSLFDEFRDSAGEGCGKDAVMRHRDQAVVVQWPPSALIDLDVPRDYERIWTQLSVGP